MSSWTPAGPGPAAQPPAPAYPPPQVGISPGGNRTVENLATSLAVVVGWFVVAAVVGALVWEKAATLPEYTRVATTGSMDEEQLSHQFSISGWFLVIAVVGGLVSGVLLMLLRRRQPVAMVVMVALGGALATWVMLQVGLALGPGDPNAALAGAKLGEKVPVRLKPDVDAVYYAWSIAALVGSIISLWILEAASTRAGQNRQNVSPAGHQFHE